MMAELALTVARVDWSVVASEGLSKKLVRTEVRQLIVELRDMTERAKVPSQLRSYITDAFAEASR